MFFLIAAARIVAAEIPAGTRLNVRLQTEVASNRSKPGDPVAALVMAALGPLPPFLKAKGMVKQARKHGGKGGRAVLELHFSELAGFPLQARVVDVDNAREWVDDQGIIHGLPPLASPSKVELLLLLAAHAHPVALAAAEGVELALSRATPLQIVYPPGVEITLELTAPLALKPPLPAEFSGYAREQPPDPAVVRLVAGLPGRTMAERPPKPSDLTNLAFIASEEALRAAFIEAGWFPASAAHLRTDAKTFLALAEKHAYQEAPVSTLLLDGRKPDLVFQQQNNTFSKRHHIRIWRWPESVLERPVWVGAATHDIAIFFSRQARTFSHRVDPRIDRERANVIQDLDAARQIESISYVDRPDAPRSDKNATGDRIETDGRLAVLILRTETPKSPGLLPH